MPENLTSLSDIKRRRQPDRERAGVSQATLAERLRTSRPNVSRIERENDIRLSTLERYVEALGGRVVIDVVIDDERIPLLR